MCCTDRKTLIKNEKIFQAYYVINQIETLEHISNELNNLDCDNHQAKITQLNIMEKIMSFGAIHTITVGNQKLHERLNDYFSKLSELTEIYEQSPTFIVAKKIGCLFKNYFNFINKNSVFMGICYRQKAFDAIKY